jgi:Trk K+ transport system NAD-binding subunit
VSGDDEADAESSASGSASTEAQDLSERTGHVIVCGLHGVGLRTVEQLVIADIPVVVVDDIPDRSLIRQLLAWNVPYVEASARQPETMGLVGIAGALAVIIAESDDVISLEISLLIRRLQPAMRVIVQLTNPSVGRALEEVTGSGTVLSTAALAAPSVVEACVRPGQHSFELDGEHFAVTHVTATQSGSLRQLYGALAPIGVLPVNGQDLVIAPGRDFTVGPGDQVALIGATASLPAGETAVRAGEAGVSFVVRMRRLIGSILSQIDRPLRITLGAMVFAVVLSTVVLRLAYHPHDGSHFGLLDALYFTAVTDATVGYGDYTFSGQPPALMVFGIGDILVGAALAAALFAQVTNLLVNRRLAEALGRQKVGGMSGHVVVVGLGSIGVRVIEGLKAYGKEVVVVERDEENRYLAQARSLDVPVIIADAALSGTFDLINLDTASAVAILTSDDLTNIEVGLAVRERLASRWAKVPVVLRVLDKPLAATMEQSFGFRNVRSTSALAAPWFVGAALGLHILDTFYIDQQPFLLGRLEIGQGLDGLAMQDLSARTRVVAINRAADGGQLEHPPRRGTRFADGDVAYIVGPYEELLRVLRDDQGLQPAAVVELPPDVAEAFPAHAEATTTLADVSAPPSGAEGR